MNITRRSIVIGLPAAASGLLVGCGGGGKSAASPGPAIDPGRADAAGIFSIEEVSGQISVISDSANFPSYLTAIRPSGILTQACINSCTFDYVKGKFELFGLDENGQYVGALKENDLSGSDVNDGRVLTEINIELCHAVNGNGPSRSISLTLRKFGIWAPDDDRAITFSAYNVYKPGVVPPSKSVTGMTSHLEHPLAANQRNERYFHRFTSGKVTATRRGDLLSLEFPSTLSEALTATKDVTALTNKASSTGTVRLMNTTARPAKITVKLEVGNEATV